MTYIGYGIGAGHGLQAEAGATLTQDFQLNREPLALQELAVVGTRAAERTSTEAPVPVDVLTAAEIKQTGRTETAQIIQALAPSFNFPRATISDGTDHTRPATLRGLAPDQVLVLVNGKRRHASALINVNGSIGRGSGMVDLNAIPASAIERIEILRDGAAAQYGSDAIAGVINIILKEGAPNELSTTAGQTVESDGEVIQGGANYALALGGDGVLQIAGEYRNRGFTNRSAPDLRTQYFAGDPRNSDPVSTGRSTTGRATPTPRTAGCSSTSPSRWPMPPRCTSSAAAPSGAGSRPASSGARWTTAPCGPSIPTASCR